MKHPTAVRNFYDEAEIRRVYYPAVEAFMRAALGADRVVIFDHTVRKRVEGAADIRGAGPRQPATRVHVDQTVGSGPNRVREHLPDEADELLKGRVQVINLWRPIRGPVRDAPLAMADGTTVAPGRSRRLRPDLSEPQRRDLFGEIQSEPSLVLFPRDDRGRGAAAEVLRLRRPMAARALGLTRLSSIRPRRPTPRRARASKSARWCFTGRRACRPSAASAIS